MPSSRSIAAVAAVLASLGLPAVATAQAPSSTIAPSDGFGLKRSGPVLRLDIGRAAGPVYRSIAGRPGVLSCQEDPDRVGRYFADAARSFTVQSFRVRVPQPRRGFVVSRRASRALDSCELIVAARGRRAAMSVLIAVTDRGAAVIAERRLVVRMGAAATVLGTLAGEQPEGAYPATDAAVAGITSRRAVARLVGPVEPLGGPDASPTAPEVVGVWTDAAGRAVVAAVTADGRRIFIESDADALSSNSPYAVG